MRLQSIQALACGDGALLRRQGGIVDAATPFLLVNAYDLDPVLGDVGPFTAYLVAIMITAWHCGLGPSLLTLGMGAVLADYCFVEPRGSLLLRDLEHQVSLGLFVVVGVVVALLSESLLRSRRRAEAALSELAAAKQSADRAKESAEQANRAKDHFLAVLSHELRTPMTPVVMGVSMLQDRTDLAPAVRETLEMIGRSIAMEARLIDDLLDVSRIARGKVELHKQRVDLCTVIQQAADVCKPDIEVFNLSAGRIGF